MLKKLLLTFIIFLPMVTSADEIVSLDWLASNNTLIAQVADRLLFITGSNVEEVKGPNDDMQDASLFENDSQILVATKNGVFKSSLADIQWDAFNDGLETTDIQFVFTNIELQNVLYAATQDTVYKFTPDDDGWVNMDIGPGGAVTDYLHSNMPDSMETGWIFASTETGIAFTADCFCFWRDVMDFNHNVLAITYQPEQPSTYFAVTEESIFITIDGARSWNVLTTPPFKNTSAMVTAGLNTLYVGTDSGEIWMFDRDKNQWNKVYS